MKNFFHIIWALAILSFSFLSCQPEKPVDDRFSVYDKPGEMTGNLSFPAEGGIKKLHLFSGIPWSSEGVDWISLEPASGTSGSQEITIAVQPNGATEERMADLQFKTGGELRHTIVVGQEGKPEEKPAPEKPEPEKPEPENPEVDKGTEADILDIVFHEDGTATNAADGFGLQVRTLPGAGLIVYRNESAQRPVAHFSNAAGKNTSDGFYRADYAGNTRLIEALKDGHSMEIMFSTSFRPDGRDELKMFSTHESGGTGFLVVRGDRGKCITFLPNVSHNGGSNWIWTTSGVVPEPGRYYHVIGVWDKKAGKSYIYVDGELKGSADASGELNLPRDGAHWFGIGADASTGGNGQGAWEGDIVYAKVFDQVLDAAQVKEIYRKEKIEQAPVSIQLSDLVYLSECRMPTGYRYRIYGKGFKAGDKVRFVSTDGSVRQDCEARIEDWGAAVLIPEGFISGSYRMFAVRGKEESPIGKVDMTITLTQEETFRTNCVAHRCYHRNGSSDREFPENSLAAFKRTQELGAWGAEIDVWITSDDVVVVNHNGTVPTDSKNRSIQYSTYKELSDIRLANGEPLPTLESFLDQMKARPGLKMVLEIKTHSSAESNARVVDKCVSLIKEKGLEDQVVWIAFDYNICKRAAAAFPEELVMYLGGDRSPSACKADGVMGIDYNGGNLTDSMIREAHELGMTVNVWTINDEASMLKFMAKGVDLITTDHPDLLQRLIDKPFVTKD